MKFFSFKEEEQQLIFIIRFAPILFTFILAILVMALVIFETNKEFENNRAYIEESYYALNKEHIKEHVEAVYNKLEQYKRQREELFSTSTKKRVNEAYDIATNLYNKYKNKKSKEEILELIKESLRNLKFFDGNGYYFIFDPKGTILMHGQNASIEGSSLWNYKDIEGTYSFQVLTSILNKQPETFFTWYWGKTNTDIKDHKKLGYFKTFEPYGFYIGTGNYIEDFDAVSRKNILEEIEKMRFHDGQGYIFVVDYDGVMLAHDDKSIVNTNTINWSDKNGYKIIENIIKLAKEQGSGYIEYDGVKKPTTQLVSFKTSFVKSFDSWQWVIGAGFYNDDINAIIEQKIVEQKENNLEYIQTVMIFCLIIMAVLLLISIFISNILKKKFEIFKHNLKLELQKNRIQNKKLEKTLNQKTEYENVVFNNNMVSITDVKGTIIYVNEAFIEATGYSENELLGRRHNIMKDPTVPEIFFKELWQTIVKGNIWRGIVTNIKKNKQKIYLSTTISPIKNSHGKIIKFVATHFDITEKINSDRELQEKENMLVQQSKMATMGEMIASIAHQWRQPLSSISVTSTGVKMQKELEILDDTMLNEAMDSIHHNVKYLSQTIDDFRHFFNPKKCEIFFNLSEVFAKCMRLIQAQLQNHEITIVEDIEPVQIKGSENELLQVLINLINNAKDQLILKKVESKVIFFKVKKEKHIAVITITDNAGGVPKEYIEKIFDPYFTTKEENNGTGIGLYMSKNIIQNNMGGQLTVHNETVEHENKSYVGASFIIKLPLEKGK